MYKHILSLLTAIFFLTAFTTPESDKPAYLLYTPAGDTIRYSDLIEKATRSDIIFFGELHNNAIAHWLQHELVRDLSDDTTRKLKLGLEMLEADQQVLIDEYFAGHISQASFESEARLWDNYQTDYKPIVEFARENGIPVIATNIPRRYASSIYHQGPDVLDGLDARAQQWMAPLPIEVDKELPSYQKIAQATHGHGGDNLVYSQAAKDATMAHFILLNMGLYDRMIHINGSYHSNNREGILWYIHQAVRGYEILTINTITREDITTVDPEDLQLADVTLVVPSRMTTTY